MMGLDTSETCRGWRDVLRIICASSWFPFTRLHDSRPLEHRALSSDKKLWTLRRDFLSPSFQSGYCDASVNCLDLEDEVRQLLRNFGNYVSCLKLLAPELFFLILAHPVYKMWIIQEQNTLELWNKLHFEEKKNGEYIPCLKYSVPIFVE
jgi:hypothetical protein